MELILYANHSEKNKLHKDLTEIATLSGTLRTGCSIVNPQIVIQLDPQTVQQSIIGGHVVDDNGEPVLDDNGVPVLWSFISKILSANYVRIPDFNRYYFVDNITSVNKDLWMLTLISDGIMSFEDRIRNTTALIARNEFTFDDGVEDNRLICQYQKTVEETEIVMDNPFLTPTNIVDNAYINTDMTVGVSNGGCYYEYDLNTIFPDGIPLLHFRINAFWTDLGNMPDALVFTVDGNNHLEQYINIPSVDYGYSQGDFIFDSLFVTKIYVNARAGSTPLQLINYVTFDSPAFSIKDALLVKIHEEQYSIYNASSYTYKLNDVLSEVRGEVTEFATDNIRPFLVDIEDDMNSLLDYVLTHANTADFIVNLQVLPFAIPENLKRHGIRTDPCYLGSELVNDVVLGIPDIMNNFAFINSEFTITGSSFLDYDPYTKYEIYIPYVSWISLDANVILNKKLQLCYLLNYADGSVFAFLVDVTSNKLVWGGEANCGVKVPLTATNARELANARNANTLNLILGLVASGISVAGGFLKANPIAIAGGTISGASAIGDYVTKANSMFDKATCSIASGSSGLYAPQNVRIRKTTVVPQEYDSNFAHTFGKPLNKHKRIGDLTGMTVVGECHLEGFDTATSQELDSIEATLKAGIII